MLTVLIETKDHEEALARTLASLVSAAVEGTVRDVLVCDLGSADQTRYVAEHAGCHYIAEGGVTVGLRQARGEWIVLLEPGSRMVDGWTGSVLAHTAGQTKAARFSRTGKNAGSLLSNIFRRREPLADGILMTKRHAMALLADDTNAQALASRVKTCKIEGQIVAALRR